MSEGSESTLFVLARLCHIFTAERKSQVKCRETQMSIELDNDVS
jgi:hypothetical protein